MIDLSYQMMQATVQVGQPAGEGPRVRGTGFLVSAPRPDGTPRVVLVSAAHVLDRTPDRELRIGWRFENADGSWRFEPGAVPLRTDAGPLYVRHPSRDIAVMAVEAPPEFAAAAIPIGYLADETTFERHALRPADEMLALGYPGGLSATAAGFPILRAGRVASYPLGPTRFTPNFLLDFRVFSGNSGGPVFMDQPRRMAPPDPEPEPESRATEPTPGQTRPAQFVAGLLTGDVRVGGAPLEIGVVVHAAFIREAVALLDQPNLPPAAAPGPPSGGAPAPTPTASESADRPQTGG